MKQFGLIALAAVVTVAVSWPAFGGFWHRLQFQESAAGEQSFAHVIENRHGVITVTEDARIYGGGMYDGVFSTGLVDDRNMIVRPYSIGAFREDPRDVLMIGLSSGSWAQVVVNHPAVERLTIVEINPGYVDLVSEYDEVSSLLRNPKVEVVIDDGRRWLNRNPDMRFDLVVMNTSFHWRAHTTNLLSVEFLQLLREHLKPGGAAIYNTTGSLRVQRTACAVFPHVVRVINNVVVSDSPLVPNRERWRRVLGNYEIDGDPVFDLLNPVHRMRLEETLQLLDSLVEEPRYWGMETRSSIMARTEGLELITDDNMGTEWSMSPAEE